MALVGRKHSVHDQFDVTLEDQELLDEVDLTTSLIIAASESDTALSQEQIDEILGVVPVDPESPQEPASASESAPTQDVVQDEEEQGDDA
ncbi:hypothetical protein ASG90_00505 [Nocardioides sp. Soil797]|nr:hypothetical protein ASG90_00505 [Nocardioides sp. Soil797]